MNITAQQVKQLRDETGAGIMDAKRALQDSNGDMDKAKKLIVAKGMERADKKADRETGVIQVFAYAHFNGKTAAIVKLACETDFVAKTDAFQKLGREIAMQIASMQPASVDDLLKQDYLRDPKKTVSELIKEVSGKTGENVRVLDLARL